jgi:hypothetical protein
MIAFCFYTPESYEKLMKVADDKKTLCDTYTDWLVEFSKAVEGLKSQGVEVVPVSINIDELAEWCNNKIKNTSASRSRYVAEISSRE